MIEWLTTTLLVALLILPFISATAAWYLFRLSADAVKPPVLLLMLTAQQIVSFLSSSYIAALTVNARLFRNVNPPELVPITLLALVIPLAMGPIIAFMLWRTRGATGGKGPKGATGPKGDPGDKGPKGATGKP